MNLISDEQAAIAQDYLDRLSVFLSADAYLSVYEEIGLNGTDLFGQKTKFPRLNIVKEENQRQRQIIRQVYALLRAAGISEKKTIAVYLAAVLDDWGFFTSRPVSDEIEGVRRPIRKRSVGSIQIWIADNIKER